MKKITKGILWLTVLVSSVFLNAQTNCINYTILQSDIGIASETFGVSLADFNGDGWKDVVIIDAYDDIEVYFYDVSNNRMGTEALSLGGNSWRFGVEVIDIENDGDWDFITSPFSTSSGNGMEVWENDGLGNFSLKADGVGGNASGYEFAVDDLNGDGYTDIFFPHGDIDILLNDGSGNFISNGQTNLYASSPEAVVLADFDADNDLDAALVRGGGSGFVGKIYLNDGSGQFSDSGQELSYGDEGVDAADIDGDGDLDLITAPSSGSLKIYLNDGLGNFMPGDTLNEVSNLYNDIQLLDQNYDGYPDIFTDANIWLNDANNPGSFILQDYTINVSTHDFEVVDINNDNFLDIYMGRFSSSNGDNIYLCNEPTINNLDEVACFGDSVFLQNAWQTEAGTYLDNAGCEIYTATNLSFYDEVNMEVTETEEYLAAVENDAEYQWLDCANNFAPISGEISQTFTPSQSGNFAVEITQNGICVDTSACVNFIYVSVTENSSKRINIYPNPNAGEFQLESRENVKSVEITDITGRIVFQKEQDFTNLTVDISAQSSGLYFIRLQMENSIEVIKMKKK